jgi:hypothetical protein
MDPSEIFARNGCFSLSDGKLSQTIFIMTYEDILFSYSCHLRRFLRFLQFLHSMFLNDYSISWLFEKLRKY